jgi:hypothetical protein
MKRPTNDPRLLADQYRERTSRMVVFNMAQRQCKGPCKQRRSVARFIEGGDVCFDCRRRAQ